MHIFVVGAIAREGRGGDGGCGEGKDTVPTNAEPEEIIL